jgi:hypothetical protein
MDSSSIPSGPGVRPDAVTVETAPRPTARTVGAPFSEVLAGGARAFVRGATVAARAIPGSPLMAVALRNGSVTGTMPVSTALPEGPSVASAGLIGLGSGVVSGGGMGAVVGVGAANLANSGALSGGVAATSGTSTSTSTGDGSLDSVMAQDQEMNLYYLQIQEEVNAQNRTYSALSNVIEVEHSTAKTAIGNIH